MSQLSDRSVLQFCVTGQFYLENKRKIHPRGVRACRPKRREERESACTREREPRHFGSSFYVFFPPPGLPYVNWASQECCLFYLRSSLWSSPRTFLYLIFAGFSLPCLLATIILDSIFIFSLPNSILWCINLMSNSFIFSVFAYALMSNHYLIQSYKDLRLYLLHLHL